MLTATDLKDAVLGLGEKTFGLVLEAAGTITGNERLCESGRRYEEAGSERLSAVQEEAKATTRMGRARAAEARERSFQDDPGPRRSGSEPSGARAAGEGAKGALKQVAGAVTGDEDMREEGRA